MEAIDKGHEEIALRIIEAGASPHIQHEVDLDIRTSTSVGRRYM